MLSTFLPPCVEMQIPVNVRQKSVKGASGELEFSVSYLTEKYQEITNIKGFDLKTLWSNTGGYIGIFLGKHMFIPNIKNIKSFFSVDDFRKICYSKNVCLLSFQDIPWCNW